jgi:predicted nucleotidyltransferase component of viral defense system
MLEAAQAASISDVQVDTEVVLPEISKDSTRSEILDYIMVFLCERIDVSVSVFKGGYVLTKLIPNEARLTEDIDFSISEERQYYDIIPVLKDLGENLLSLGIIASYEVKDTIAPTSSGGIKMMPVDGSSNIKIDIGWHDLSWGVSSWQCLGFNCNRFEVERMLSDKISAIYSRKRFRRTKDIYDFYILTNNFDVSLSKLREYITKRGLIEWDRDPFREDVLTEYAKSYDKLRVQTATGELINKPEFNKIILRLRYFMNEYNSNCIWDHLERAFKEYII